MACFFCLVVEQMILAVIYRCLWWTVASRTITFRRRDNLHEVGERLYFLLVFVVLGHPVRQLSARALKLTYCPIEMYGKGALPLAKMCPSWNARAFHAYFCLTWNGLLRDSTVQACRARVTDSRCTPNWGSARTPQMQQTSFLIKVRHWSQGIYRI